MGRYSRRCKSLGKQDIQQLFRKNDRAVDDVLLVLSRKNQLDSSRLGLAISKKHITRAVGRNRVKRLVRESFMQHQPFSSPQDVIVLSRPGLARRSNQQIFGSLARLWQQINRKSG